MLAEPQACIRTEMGRCRLWRQLIECRPPSFCRVLQLGDDHWFPERANAYWHRAMIKEVPNECASLLCALALIETPGSCCASREQRIALSALVDFPMIEEHPHIGPSSLMITLGKRVRGIGPE